MDPTIENAEIIYSPDDDGSHAGIESALPEIERLLSDHVGVTGVGITKTPDGVDAVIVYCLDQQALDALPATLHGHLLIGEVTGEVQAY